MSEKDNKEEWIDYDLYKILGRLLREYREEKELSSTQVSEIIGKANSSIQRWERADRKITVSDLNSLCKVYGTTYIEILNKTKILYTRDIRVNATDHIISKYGSDAVRLLDIYQSLSNDGKYKVMDYAEVMQKMDELTEKKDLKGLG